MPYVISDEMREQITNFLEKHADIKDGEWGNLWTAFKDGQGDAPIDINLWNESHTHIGKIQWDSWDEVLSVKQIGEQIGYGNMMCIASALWRVDLKTKWNLPPICAYVPQVYFNIKRKARKKQQKELELYDQFIKDPTTFASHKDLNDL
jgi:hypothetical protein